jgi:hypothetical protein
MVQIKKSKILALTEEAVACDLPGGGRAGMDIPCSRGLGVLDNPHRRPTRARPAADGCNGQLLAEGVRSILLPRATQAGVHPMPRPIAHRFHIVHFHTDLICHLDAAPRPSIKRPDLVSSMCSAVQSA